MRTPNHFPFGRRDPAKRAEANVAKPGAIAEHLFAVVCLWSAGFSSYSRAFIVHINGLAGYCIQFVP